MLWLPVFMTAEVQRVLHKHGLLLRPPKPPGLHSPHSQTAIPHGRVLVKNPPEVLTIQLTEGYRVPLVTRNSVVLTPQPSALGPLVPLISEAIHLRHR